MDGEAEFGSLLEEVEAFADDVLRPLSATVDQAAAIPTSNYESLAQLGLFAMALPRSAGGPGLSPPRIRRIMRVLGGGCGATAFAFAQHHGVVGAVARTENRALREQWLPKLATGTLGGTAFAHVRRAGPAAVRAIATDGGWLLDGEAPWGTSWGSAAVFSVAATSDEGDLVWVLVPGVEAEGFTVSTPLSLMVFGATATVRFTFDSFFVPHDQVLTVAEFAPWQSDDRRAAARPNPLCLGVGDRALTLLAEAASDRVDPWRQDWQLTLDRAEEASVAVDERSDDIEAIAAVRAESVLAVQRLTTALLAASGGRGAELGHPAQQLAREALFYVVQAQNADGRAATLDALTVAGRRAGAGG